MKRRMIGQWGAAILAAPFIRPAHAQENGTVRIGWLRAPNDLTTGRARGTLVRAMAARGLKVDWAGPFPAAAPALEALNAGSIDITAGSSTACITALAAGVPMRIFACQKLSAAAEAILVPANSAVGGVQDLKGRSVAVNRGGTGEYLLMRALETHGVDAGAVRRVYLSPGDSGAALTQGHVDAWATWDPFVTIARHAYGARVLADGAAIGSANAVTLMVSEGFLQQRRPDLQGLMRTVLADNAWAQAHPAEAGGIWTQAMGLPEAMSAEIGRNSAVPTRAVTQEDVAQIGQIADWYVASRIVPRRPDIAAGVVMLEG